jgi:hypothetical protein
LILNHFQREAQKERERVVNIKYVLKREKSIEIAVRREFTPTPPPLYSFMFVYLEDIHIEVGRRRILFGLPFEKQS